jgi:mono/diheme cytochrome c family protein
MRKFLTVVGFSLLTIAFFAGYSNFGIPQIEPAPPPTEEKLDLGAMTMEQFVALGGEILTGKGTCTLCHNALGRAPMLDSLGGVIAERLADSRYQGKATNAEEYILESLVEPSAYVVAGFGKKGSDDTVSPMPDVSKGGIALSEAELAAVTAYLQDLGGLEVTVEVPAEVAEAAEQPEDEAEEDEPRPPIESIEALVVAFDCGACHVIAGEEGELGPDLSTIGATRDRDFLRRAILDPNADVAEGYEPEMMPDDLGQRMYAQELELLVDYLAGLR